MCHILRDGEDVAWQSVPLMKAAIAGGKEYQEGGLHRGFISLR